MKRLRTGDVNDRDVKKLLSLHLDAIEKRHGRAVFKEIKDGAIYLFFRNARRIRRNLEMISELHTADNPIAIVRPQSARAGQSKAVSVHFSGNTPTAAFLCIGAKVCLDNKNYCPLRGLYNGACSIVDEIVFAKGESPNTTHQPAYVVVNFPAYTGPVWDDANPTVRIALSQRCSSFPFFLLPNPHPCSPSSVFPSR